MPHAGARAVTSVDAAARAGVRHLVLLHLRVKLFLCIVATRHALHGVSEEDD